MPFLFYLLNTVSLYNDHKLGIVALDKSVERESIQTAETMTQGHSMIGQTSPYPYNIIRNLILVS